MPLLRRLMFIAMGSVFRLLLLVGVSLLGIGLLLGKPTHLERSLVDQGVYTKFVPAIIDSLKANQRVTDTIPLDDKNVQKIMSDAFPPALLQKNSELVIDNTYSWFDGRIAEPDFKIDFTAQRQLVADNLTAYAFNRLAAQPLCKTQPMSVNPFTDTCLPRSFNLAAERAVFSDELHNLLPQTVYTAQDLPKAKDGKTIPDAYPQIPSAYHFMMEAPWIIGGLLILLSIAMISLTTTPRRGIRLVGSAILSSGITLIITPLLYLLVYPAVERAIGLQSSNQGLNALSTGVIQDLSHSFYSIIISLSLGVIALGIAILMIERSSRGEAYADLEVRSGVISSDSRRRRLGGPDNTLKPEDVPIQSSERALTNTTSKKKVIKYRTLKKKTDKELRS